MLSKPTRVKTSGHKCEVGILSGREKYQKLSGWGWVSEPNIFPAIKYYTYKGATISLSNII